MIISSLPDSLKLSEISLAGSHDSATAFTAFKKWARCQDKSFNEQLSLGIRLFDIRLSKSGGGFYLVHSVADCYTDATMKEKLTFDEVLKACADFLRANPRETIVMSVKKDRGLKGVFDKLFFKSFYNRYIENNRELWFTENCVPDLSECRGRLVLMRRCKRPKSFLSEDECGLNFSVWKNQKTEKDTEPFTVTLNGKCSALVQDSYSVDPYKKREIIKDAFETVTPAKNRFAVSFLSTSGGGMTPTDSSKIINEYFKEYKMKSNSPAGWVFLDFPTRELCDKITEQNNIYKER